MFLCSVKKNWQIFFFLLRFSSSFSCPIFIWTFSFLHLYCLSLQFLFISYCFSSVMNGVMTSPCWELTGAGPFWSLQSLSIGCLHSCWIGRSLSEFLKWAFCPFSECLLTVWGLPYSQVWETSALSLCFPPHGSRKHLGLAAIGNLFPSPCILELMGILCHLFGLFMGFLSCYLVVYFFFTWYLGRSKNHVATSTPMGLRFPLNKLIVFECLHVLSTVLTGLLWIN